MRYTYLFILFVVLSIFVFSACTNRSDDNCPSDFVICADGKTQTRDGNNECSFPVCSDGRQYVSGDSDQCTSILFQCAEGKRPFFDNQGCGCEPIPTQNDTQTELSMQCISYGGIYIAGVHECEGITREQCNEMDGRYDNCASACRNDPDADVCTLQCVEVCDL